MDSSYITHQRRPALIPDGTCLSPVDEAQVSMRIANALPLSSYNSHLATRLAADQPLESCTSLHRNATLSNSSKRKASITAEDYHEVYLEQNQSSSQYVDRETHFCTHLVPLHPLTSFDESAGTQFHPVLSPGPLEKEKTTSEQIISLSSRSFSIPLSPKSTRPATETEGPQREQK